MTGQKTELEKRRIVRLSNKEANRLTKECLINALKELLKNKDLDRITVSELTRKAGVSRTAFYSNYDSIQDVLRDGVNEFLTWLNDQVLNAINHESNLFYPLIKGMQEQSYIVKILVKSNIEQTILEQMGDYILTRFPGIDRRTYYLIIGTAGLVRNITYEWFGSGCRESAAEISGICDELTRPLRAAVIEQLQVVSNHTQISK